MLFRSGLVWRWLIDEVIWRPNVILLCGNHELILQDYLNWHENYKTSEKYSIEFEQNTLPQLLEAGFYDEECKYFLSKLHNYCLYCYQIKKGYFDWQQWGTEGWYKGLRDWGANSVLVAVSHGGVDNILENKGKLEQEGISYTYNIVDLEICI